MKRIRTYGWNSVTIGMTSRWTAIDRLELIPFCHECGQMMFRFMVE